MQTHAKVPISSASVWAANNVNLEMEILFRWNTYFEMKFIPARTRLGVTAVARQQEGLSFVSRVIAVIVCIVHAPL